MRAAVFLVAVAFAAVLAAPPQDGRPLSSELCTTVAHTPLVVHHDDACFRLSADIVHGGGASVPAIEWRGKRGQLQFGGHALTLADSCARGVVVASGASLAVFDADITLANESSCPDMVAIYADYGASLAVYDANLRDVAAGVVVMGGVAGTSLTAVGVNVYNVTSVGVGCDADECYLERTTVHMSSIFNFQTGIFLRGNVSRAVGTVIEGSLWRGLLLNTSGPVFVDDLSVTGSYGALIEVRVADAVQLGNVRTSGQNLAYPVHLGVIEASTLLVDGWVARDGDIGMIVVTSGSQRGITVRNANLAGLYYGIYMQNDNWNLIVRDSSIATCCIGVFADTNAHNIIVTDTMFENNFDSLDIQTPESVAANNLNTGDGYGFCYSPLRRRSNVPPPVPNPVTPSSTEVWWAVPHPYNGEN